MATWARVQGTSAQASALAFGSNVVSGNLLLVALRLGNTTHTFTSVTDSVGTTYTQVATGSPQTVATDHKLYLLWGVAAGSGANTVTVNGSGFGTNRLTITEYSGNHATPFDVSAGAGGVATSAVSSGNLTTGTADDLLFACMSDSNGVATITAGSGYTKRNDIGAKLADEDQGISAGVATGTYAGTFTLSVADDWGCIAAAFKPSTGGGATAFPHHYYQQMRR